MENGIRSIEIKNDQAGNHTSIKVVFGPHYFLEINDVEGHTEFTLIATHHGFKVDATEVGKGLEEIIYLVKENYPETSID